MVMPEGLQRLSDWPSLTRAMELRGWREERILRVLGANWLRFFADVWEARAIARGEA
jgi:membrane dipeptidase